MTVDVGLVLWSQSLGLAHYSNRALFILTGDYSYLTIVIFCICKHWH